MAHKAQPNANKKTLDSQANVLRLSNVEGNGARDVQQEGDLIMAIPNYTQMERCAITGKDQKQITIKIYRNTRPQVVRDICFNYAHRFPLFESDLFSGVLLSSSKYVVENKRTIYHFNLVRGREHFLDIPFNHRGN